MPWRAKSCSCPPSRPACRRHNPLALRSPLRRGDNGSKLIRAPGERAFVIAPLAAKPRLENAFIYGELASGATYVESDPIGLRGGTNPYAYAADDPIGSFDTDGLDRRRVGDPDVTQICGYYDDVCRKTGGKCNYPCKTAPFLCQHPDMIPSLWAGVSNSQINCIRTCLIAEDKKAQKAVSSNCPNGKCLSNDTINDYHKTCYTKCGVGAWRFPGVGSLGN